MSIPICQTLFLLQTRGPSKTLYRSSHSLLSDDCDLMSCWSLLPTWGLREMALCALLHVRNVPLLRKHESSWKTLSLCTVKPPKLCSRVLVNSDWELENTQVPWLSISSLVHRHLVFIPGAACTSVNRTDVLCALRQLLV